MKTLGILALSILFIFFSCKKDSFITSPNANVIITADTLKFDTVFVTAGSITQSFKILNQNNQKLLLSSVKLMGGSGSTYKINVDGAVGPQVNNLEIEANDSLYVFVQVNINQNASNLPFIVRDSIQISYNGNNINVQLEAWGKNAHFFLNKEVSADETWNNDLPYVILGNLHVQANHTLTINQGCHIYVHANAPIVVDGTMQINGLKDTFSRVYFSGDRLDDPYKDFPASWPGIFFNTGSKDNVFNFTVIENSYQSIAAQDPSSDANPKVTLNECVIDNSYDAGIISVNSSIKATNCLISNCGKNIYLEGGGNYQFIHCTAASYSNNFILHKDPVLAVSNYVNVNNVPVAADLNALFRNCIFWGDNGSVNDEVVVAKSGSTIFNVNFDYNLWKVQTVPVNITSAQIINNQDPQFDSINTIRNYYNFRLKAASPAIKAGANAGVSIDLDSLPRPASLPDLGCFEKH